MNILLVYETYSGGTFAASEFAVQELKQKGHAVDIKRANEMGDAKTNFDGYDLIMLATPSWLERNTEGQPPNSFLQMMEENSPDTFKEKKFAVFGLGDESYAHFCKGVDILKEFLDTQGATIIGEPLKIDNYLMNEQKNNEQIQQWLESLHL